MHPTKTLVNLIDNSSGHTCRTPTALNVNLMNKGPGGARKELITALNLNGTLPDMHNTVWNGKDHADNVMNEEWAARPVAQQLQVQRHSPAT